ncbi:unnamed protein product [Allacma fusca]|uniref:Uncharacterized protein n=1 Tax=Allacma fusca TaxID=39272 RepID=A0A8J2KAK5_9HEXA|nr:unnamed protein product [Allacma fusca]
MSNTINTYNKRRPSFVSSLDCAQKQYQLGKQAPIWIQDSRVSMCQACATEFSMTFRRHHCRSCGKVVCRHCSANEAPLQYLEYETGRVCDSCYEVILNDFEVNYEDKESKTFYQIRQKFKKFNIGMPPPRKHYKSKRTVRLPSKIDEDNNTTAKVCSHLQWKEKKVWRRNWFVLVDCVLYIFAASDDVAAIKTLPVLGYTVEAGGSDDDSDKEISFKLRHQGTGVISFQAESSRTAEKWIDALNEAIRLKAAE